MKTILLSKGKNFAIVDDEDFEPLSRFNWRVSESKLKRTLIKYAVRSKWINGKSTTICMHREIMRPPDSMNIDHKNGDGLDNQKDNLRLANDSQNLANSRKRRSCSSKYKGVCWHKWNKKWCARTRVNGLLIHLGHFNDELSAAIAYDRAAEKYFGEFALTNKAMNLFQSPCPTNPPTQTYDPGTHR